jgi:hypothetical protein
VREYYHADAEWHVAREDPDLAVHRGTVASLLYALGEPPTVVMAEMGHTTPGLAPRIYAQVMPHGEDERAALAVLVDGEEFRPIDADKPSEQADE